MRARPHVEDFGRFGDWATDLWHRCRLQHRCWVRRDEVFLRWRYDERPESHYAKYRVDIDGRACGYVVLTVAERDQGRVCFVMDLVADLDAPGALESMLGKIEGHARDSGCAFISAMAGPNSPMRGHLLRHAYLPLPENYFPQELHFGARMMEGHSGEAALDPGAWQLTWGDVDVL